MKTAYTRVASTVIAVQLVGEQESFADALDLLGNSIKASHAGSAKYPEWIVFRDGNGLCVEVTTGDVVYKDESGKVWALPRALFDNTYEKLT